MQYLIVSLPFLLCQFMILRRISQIETSEIETSEKPGIPPDCKFFSVSCPPSLRIRSLSLTLSDTLSAILQSSSLLSCEPYLPFSHYSLHSPACRDI
ncbi:hypothetical protein PFISCL1PPCAC_6667, partial [Pristionchus fissidentatus]